MYVNVQYGIQSDSFVINTTLTCITQMIIWLCDNACIYALGVQGVNHYTLRLSISMQRPSRSQLTVHNDVHTLQLCLQFLYGIVEIQLACMRLIHIIKTLVCTIRV